MSKTITITGLSDLSDMLTHIVPKAAKSYLVKCAKPAAQLLVDRMESTAPVGASGKLSKSVLYKNRWEDADGVSSLVTRVGPAKKTPWGMWQEFGTSKMPGKHWMSSAWESSKSDVLEVYMEGVHSLIERLVARDQSEATLENDYMDRISGNVSAARLARDRRAAYRENKLRDKS